MEEIPQTSVEEFGHLGLVAAIVKKFNISGRIDKLIPKTSNNQKISHADGILAMIYQGLGFGDGRLYFAKEFMSNKPLEKLFGKEDLSSDLFNDDVLGAALDAIFSYGPTKFFSNIAFQILSENGMMSRFAHMDSTSHSFQGRKYKKQKDSDIKVNYGHSKGRADLPQIVQILATTEGGIPFWSSTHSGNSSDKNLFPESITAIQNYLREVQSELDIGFVADSALYKKEFLLNKSISCDWMARVPESIKAAKSLVSQNHKQVEWTKIDKDLKYKEYPVTYGNIKQRWIVVNNRESRYKELATFEGNLKKEEALVTKSVNLVMAKTFTSYSEAHLAAKVIIRNHPYFEFSKTILGRIKKGKGKRPRSAKGFKLHLTFNQNIELIDNLKNRKGKFIIATNDLDSIALSSEKIVEIYCGRTPNMEGCFKLLKNPSLRLNQIFLKRVDRIQALLAVMTLCLFINRLGQVELRQSLAKTKETLPNQNGIQITNPTLKWAFQLMSKVVKLKVQFSNRLFEEYKGIGESQRKIINSFGKYAQAIYGFV